MNTQVYSKHVSATHSVTYGSLEGQVRNKKKEKVWSKWFLSGVCDFMQINTLFFSSTMKIKHEGAIWQMEKIITKSKTESHLDQISSNRLKVRRVFCLQDCVSRLTLTETELQLFIWSHVFSVCVEAAAMMATRWARRCGRDGGNFSRRHRVFVSVWH